MTKFCLINVKISNNIDYKIFRYLLRVKLCWKCFFIFYSYSWKLLVLKRMQCKINLILIEILLVNMCSLLYLLFTLLVSKMMLRSFGYSICTWLRINIYAHPIRHFALGLCNYSVIQFNATQRILLRQRPTFRAQDFQARPLPTCIVILFCINQCRPTDVHWISTTDVHNTALRSVLVVSSIAGMHAYFVQVGYLYYFSLTPCTVCSNTLV